MQSNLPAPFRTRAAQIGLPLSGVQSTLPLVVGFVLLLVVAAGSVLLYMANQRVYAEVARSLEVQSAANRLLTLVQDAETGQRGYLLTKNRAYLTPYLLGSAETPKAMASLKALSEDDQKQLAIVSDLQGLIKAKFAELASTVERADQGDFVGALEIVKNNSGNSLMSDIRGGVASVDQKQLRASAERRAGSSATGMTLPATSVVGIFMVCLLAAYAIGTTKRATVRLLEAQTDLQQINRNLEGIVDARVGDLRLANEEIQRFAYIVSHDLRAPLVNVLGFTSELDAMRGDLDVLLDEVALRSPDLITADRRMAIRTDLPEALGFIRSSTMKMDRLIGAILKLSREGRRKLKAEHIDVGELVRAQRDSLSKQLGDRNAELVIEGELPPLTSDPLAIEQVFGNLIENAVKYLSQERLGRIVVSGRDERPWLIYDIADNGRGIEGKDFDRIFDLFRRSGVQDTAGEGIGLAYVRNLTRRLGGTVTVQSEYGVGSTFTVTLPSVYHSESGAEV